MPSPLEVLYQAGLTNPDLVQRALQTQRDQDALRMFYNAGLTNPGLVQQALNASQSMNLAGGYGLLDPANAAAATAASYSLGRANLARGLNQDAFSNAMSLASVAANPFNIVGYLDAIGRTGTELPINQPIVQNIEPMFPTPSGPYDQRLKDFLGGNKTPPFARGGRTVLPQEPTVLMGIYSKWPYLTASENGPEAITALDNGIKFTPQPGVSRTTTPQQRRGIVQQAYAPPGRPPQGPGPTTQTTAAPAPRNPIGIQGVGDVNQDGVINAGDQLFMATLARMIANRQYNQKFDLNRDGRITAADQLIAAYRGRGVPSYAAGGGFRFSAASKSKILGSSSSKSAPSRRDEPKSDLAKALEALASKGLDSPEKVYATPEYKRAYGSAPEPEMDLGGFLRHYATATPEQQSAYQTLSQTPGAQRVALDVSGYGSTTGPVTIIERADGSLQVTPSSDGRDHYYPYSNVSGDPANRAGGITDPATIAQAKARANAQNRQYYLSRAGISSASRGQWSPEEVAQDPDLNWIIDQFMSTGKTGEKIPADWERSPLTDQAIANKIRANGRVYPEELERQAALGNERAQRRLARGSGNTAARQALNGSPAKQGKKSEGSNTSQEAAAKLLGLLEKTGAKGQLYPEFLDALNAGKVPGISTITLTQFQALPEEVRGALIGLWISTGTVASESSIMEQLRKNQPKGF